MIVDDDRELRELVQGILEEKKYGVVQAANGAEALSYLKASATLPRLILLEAAPCSS
jgi:DNA-binding response OmpR family regulator